ncbi:hypothetical protein SUDANB145_04169 [Streptomyces sp. enrichment culture]
MYVAGRVAPRTRARRVTFLDGVRRAVGGRIPRREPRDRP